MTNGDTTSSLDLYPTFCDWANIPDQRRPPLEGHSFAADCEGRPTPGWKNLVVCACETGGGAYTLITDDGWRLTQFVGATVTGQLFNLVEDPAEQKDLYRNPEYAHLRLELNKRLNAALTRPSRIPQYRNMPEIGGTKRIRNYAERNAHANTGVPLYLSLPAPSFEE